MVTILRPENGTRFNCALHRWSQIRGPDSGPRTGAANFSTFRAFWQPGAGFLAPPGDTNRLAPEAVQLQPRTRFVAAADHNPSPGPAPQTLCFGFPCACQADWVTARIRKLAFCRVRPLPPQSRVRRSQAFAAILGSYPLKQSLLFQKFASFFKCQLASLRRRLNQESFCVICQRLHFLLNLRLRPWRLFLPLSTPLVEKLDGGVHVQSHSPHAQSCSHTEWPRKPTINLLWVRTATPTYPFTSNLLVYFSDRHRKLLQIPLATPLHGLCADRKKACAASTIPDHKNPKRLEHLRAMDVA